MSEQKTSFFNLRFRPSVRKIASEMAETPLRAIAREVLK